MTSKAKNLLKRIGDTEEASLKLNKGIAKVANELKSLGMATFIAHSQGGGDVALTQKGIEEYDRLFPEEES